MSRYFAAIAAYSSPCPPERTQRALYGASQHRSIYEQGPQDAYYADNSAPFRYDTSTTEGLYNDPGYTHREGSVTAPFLYAPII